MGMGQKLRFALRNMARLIIIFLISNSQKYGVNVKTETAENGEYCSMYKLFEQ
jgi:hypothetical protein